MQTNLAYFSLDPGVDRWMTRTIHEAGGRIDRHTLEVKFFERFNILPDWLMGNEIEGKTIGKVFKFENDAISEL